ncbi:kinase-like protein [Aspergillus uvarum CBS 121591]|uniref:non-specific serine/threonine protein kinase n=1 Tax=Aspergillus uvarum CBS 121591 TaxID=1448315 RepID=A0A319CH37_9EURO|nr:kinase-like protein [Aspergillus uvarum CBS 121591]PYH83740.1 kinase-like protein [Aspergillus uvarum CBS 121591]
MLLTKFTPIISRAAVLHGKRALCSQPHIQSRRSLWEEERLPFYKPQQFYPVHIGETLNTRYQVVGKLGYGSYSTVWLCRDKSIDLARHSENKYVAIKVLTNNLSQRALSGELGIYEHLSRLNSSHIGSAYVRGLYDTFSIPGPDGTHQCLVHPPMHLSLNELRMLSRARRLSEPLLKQTLFCILQGLDFLHREAGVVHTDIKTSNIMLSIDDESMLTDFQKAEQQNHSPRKVIDESRTIYTSRNLRLPKDMLWGQPVLCDLGQAQIGQSHRGIIQPESFRAPEVLFDMDWGSGVDIWSLGVMTFVQRARRRRRLLPSHHVAEMVAYLGLPPLSFVRRSQETRHVFAGDGEFSLLGGGRADEYMIGKWLGAGGVTIPATSLHEVEENLTGENQQLFLEFIRSMLQWTPEKRKTAQELLDDPWLNSDP